MLRTSLGSGVEWICLALMVVLSVDLLLGLLPPELGWFASLPWAVRAALLGASVLLLVVTRSTGAQGIEWLCLILMVVLSVDLMLGVFSRYVLFRTFTWYDELARVCFVWLVFLGAAVGVKRGAHFHLNLLLDALPPGLRRVVALLAPLSVLLFSAVLIVQGLDFMERGQYQSLPVMGLPKLWVYAAMPVGGVLMILHAVPALWRGQQTHGAHA